MHPISEMLCEVYSELHNRQQVSFPLRWEHRQKIDSIVKTVNSQFFGFSRYPKSEDKATAYLYFLIKNHPVVDGNKRLAILWFEVYCVIKNLSPTKRYPLDVIAVAIEQSDSSEKDEFIELLKEVLFLRP